VRGGVRACLKIPLLCREDATAQHKRREMPAFRVVFPLRISAPLRRSRQYIHGFLSKVEHKLQARIYFCFIRSALASFKIGRSNPFFDGMIASGSAASFSLVVVFRIAWQVAQ
jgi:hypothetical protein